jgi:hypothetical protein
MTGIDMMAPRIVRWAAARAFSTINKNREGGM